MNPWALLVILIGIVLIVTGIKGTQHNIAGAITGKGQQPVTAAPPPNKLVPTPGKTAPQNPNLPPQPGIGPGSERTVPPVSPM